MIDDTYRFLGRTFRLSTDSKEVSDHVRRVYGNFLLDEPGSPEEEPTALLEVTDDIEATGELVVRDNSEAHVLLCRDIHTYDLDRYEPRGRSTDPLSAVQWFVLNQISRASTDYYLVHGAAVAWEGRGVILPGQSGRGKTTMALKLAAEGFAYLSDEIVCLRKDDGSVVPFPRTASLTPESLRLLGMEAGDGDYSRRGKRWIEAGEGITPAAATTGFPLGHVVFLAGFGEGPRLTRISGATGLFTLLKHLLGPIYDANEALYGLAPLIENVDCHRLVVGGLGPTVAYLREELGMVR